MAPRDPRASWEGPESKSPWVQRKSPSFGKAANGRTRVVSLLFRGKNTSALPVNSKEKETKYLEKNVFTKKKKKKRDPGDSFFNWVGRGYFIMQQIRKFIIYHCTQSKCHPTESHPCENHHIAANCQAGCSRRAKLICKCMQEIKKQNYPGK